MALGFGGGAQRKYLLLRILAIPGYKADCDRILIYRRAAPEVEFPANTIVKALDLPDPQPEDSGHLPERVATYEIA